MEISLKYLKPNASLGGYMMVDGEVELQRFQQIFQEHVINKRNGSTFLFERLTQIPTHFWGKPFFKKDPAFQIEHHVRVYNHVDPDLHLPSPCDESDLQRILGAFMALGYKPDRSPWEYLVVNNYFINGNLKNTALAIRYHHCLGDGLSFLFWTECLFQAKLNFPKPNFRKQPLWLKVAQSAVIPFKMISDFSEQTVNTYSLRPRVWSTSGCPSNDYYTCFTPPIPVETVKRIKNNMKVSYVTVLVGACLMSFRKIMIEASQPVPKKLSFCFTTPTPNHPIGMSNHAFNVVALFDLNYDDVSSCLQHVNQTLAAKRNSAASLLMDLVLNLLSSLPKCFYSRVYDKFYLASAIATNLPVPTEPLYLDGMLVSGSVNAIAPTNSHT
ncbi:unnamed protein product, partial [Allacma fusca]